MAATLPDESRAFITIAKKSFKPAYDENDEVLIWSLGALRHGFEAMLREDASDGSRAREEWENARQALIREDDTDTGAAAQGTIAMDDDFNMEETACVL